MSRKIKRPYHISIKYDSLKGIDRKLDNEIESFMKLMGYRRWASGFDVTQDVRDIAFDLADKNNDIWMELTLLDREIEGEK